jgi:hypothetical protein
MNECEAVVGRRMGGEMEMLEENRISAVLCTTNPS